MLPPVALLVAAALLVVAALLPGSASDARGRAPVGAAASGQVRRPAPGPEVQVILSQAKLTSLGLAHGPDSIAARYTDSGGHTWLVFTASGIAHPGGPYALYRVPIDGGGATKSPAVSGRPRPVLAQGMSAEPRSPIPSCASRSCFDASYSGGGTVLQCPGDGPLLMAYHAENDLTPTGEAIPTQGWTGIGLARWDAGRRAFVKIDQIIGLNASNRWQQTALGWQTEQRPAMSFQGDMVLAPGNRMVYLYYGDRSAGPFATQSQNARVALAAITRSALCAGAAGGRHAVWKKWFHGSFSQPGVYTTTASSAQLPAGTGGRFTPILAGRQDTSPNVLIVHDRWYMVTAPAHARIDLRTSSDGIHWSAPRTVYRPRRGMVRYPYLYVPPGPTGAAAAVTFTWSSDPQQPGGGPDALEQLRLTL